MLTDEDRRRRRRGITASEVPVLMGLVPERGAIDIYAEKVGMAGPDEASLAMTLGLELEAPICRHYAQLTGLHLRPSGTLAHPVHTFALATPDRLAWLEPVPETRIESVDELAGAVRNVQAKSTEWPASQAWGPSGTDAVPARVRAQVNWEMGVTGLVDTDVPCLIGKREVRVYSLAFDERLWEAQLELAERFLVDHVWARTPPAVGPEESWEDYLYRVSGAPQQQLLDVDEGSDVERLLSWWQQLERAAAAVKAAKATARHQLQLVIGAAKGLQGEFGRLTWARGDARTSTDWEAAGREAQLVAQLAVQHLEQLQHPAAAALSEQLRTLASRHRAIGRPYSQLRAKWSPAWLESRPPVVRLGGAVVPDPKSNPQSEELSHE